MTSLNPLPPSINPKRSKRCEKKSCLSNPGSAESPRAAERAGGTKSEVGLKVMPIANIKPKIIGLVLPDCRIQFFLQGSYNAVVGKASRPLINPVLAQLKPSVPAASLLLKTGPP